MPRTLAMLSVLLPALLLLAGPVSFTAPVAAAGQMMSVTPTSREGEYRVEVHEFRANERVSVRLLGPDDRLIRLDRAKASRHGHVRVTIFIPRYEPGGAWTVRFTGMESERVVRETFTVPPRRPNAALTVSPSEGTASTTFMLAGAGFEPGESVTAWLTRPDGRGVPLYASLADGAGAVTFYTFAPLDGPPGDWFAAAYGQRSDRLGAAAFRVN
jgi:hypothetical protein